MLQPFLLLPQFILKTSVVVKQNQHFFLLFLSSQMSAPENSEVVIAKFQNPYDKEIYIVYSPI